jgi:prolyl-tRNA editing enzyme YbaK/EbsC (Cys-tRNA(Pro) deacylase)
MRGPIDLQTFIDEHAIPAQLLHLDAPTPTVETAAQVVGCQPEQVIKTILFMVDGKPVVTITAGLGYIDYRALAYKYGVGRKKVKLADADSVLTTLGYTVGGVPPFGFERALPVLIDRRVLEHETVYGGGGDDHTLVKVASRTIQQFNKAEALDLHILSDLSKES